MHFLQLTQYAYESERERQCVYERKRDRHRHTPVHLPCYHHNALDI
jgi:hypothetical protein